MVLHHESFLIRKSADIMLICSSPQLIAACHVLHRLLMPRHSPYALIRLNFFCIVFLYFGSQISFELSEFLLNFLVQGLNIDSFYAVKRLLLVAFCTLFFECTLLSAFHHFGEIVFSLTILERHQ